MVEHFDCVIVGAGLSGVGMAYQLMLRCPQKSFIILEARDNIGGTWDLFRYPGVRSDSSMVTLGYSFRPWTGEKSIASGADILSYIRNTARIHEIEQKIRFRRRVTRAAFSSESGHWLLGVEDGDNGAETAVTCGMLITCAGYYRYDQGYTPQFSGLADFKGQIIHPQRWPNDFDARGKRIVVIGSGATAVTLVPSLAETAQHVTMLQRTPSYVVPWPDIDPFANAARKYLPLKLAGSLARWRGSSQEAVFFSRSRRQPDRVRRLILDGGRLVSGSPELIAKHFSPNYNPWDQRPCLAPKGDIFKALKSGRASIITDEITCFEPTGIRLKSGKLRLADVIVTATGLNLQTMGGIALSVDNVTIVTGQLVGYKGVMYGGVPNLINTMGYVNASWTLKSDLTANFACRLLQHMTRKNAAIAQPTAPSTQMELKPWWPLSSGYFLRAHNTTPKQGSFGPWKAPQSYFRDSISLRFGRLDDGVLQFKRLGHISGG